MHSYVKIARALVRVWSLQRFTEVLGFRGEGLGVQGCTHLNGSKEFKHGLSGVG